MNKDELISAVIEAARENSTAAVFFHMAMAEATGMCPSDHKALDLILRHGGMTAGELSTETGLASASVTSLIDRLEAKGYVQRVRGRTDRRRIKVEAIPERINEVQQRFTPLKLRALELLRSFDMKQLETIRTFLQMSTTLYREKADSISAGRSERIAAGCS